MSSWIHAFTLLFSFCMRSQAELVSCFASLNHLSSQWLGKYSTNSKQVWRACGNKTGVVRNRDKRLEVCPNRTYRVNRILTTHKVCFIVLQLCAREATCRENTVK